MSLVIIINSLLDLTTTKDECHWLLSSTVYWTWPPTKDEFHWLLSSTVYWTWPQQKTNFIGYRHQVIMYRRWMANESSS
jgi:hypothetical protein